MTSACNIGSLRWIRRRHNGVWSTCWNILEHHGADRHSSIGPAAVRYSPSATPIICSSNRASFLSRYRLRTSAEAALSSNPNTTSTPEWRYWRQVTASFQTAVDEDDWMTKDVEMTTFQTYLTSWTRNRVTTTRWRSPMNQLTVSITPKCISGLPVEIAGADVNGQSPAAVYVPQYHGISNKINLQLIHDQRNNVLVNIVEPVLNNILYFGLQQTRCWLLTSRRLSWNTWQISNLLEVTVSGYRTNISPNFFNIHKCNIQTDMLVTLYPQANDSKINFLWCAQN